MTRSRSKTEMLRAMKAHLNQTRESLLQFERDNFLNNHRRLRATTRFRDRLLRKAFSDSDMLERIKIQQQKDLDAIRNFHAKQKQKIFEYSMILAERQRETIEKVSSLKQIFESSRGNPSDTVCLWFSDDIQHKYSHFSVGNATCKIELGPSYRGNSGENIAKMKTRVVADDGAAGFVSHFLDFHFMWKSKRNGILKGYSWIFPNLIYELIARPSCSGNEFARVKLGAALIVAQYTPNGTFLSSGQALTTLLDRPVEGGSSWGRGMLMAGPTAFDDFVSIETSSEFPIQGESNVICTVTIAAMIEASDGGEAELDIKSRTFQLNVPSVWLRIDY